MKDGFVINKFGKPVEMRKVKKLIGVLEEFLPWFEDLTGRIGAGYSYKQLVQELMDIKKPAGLKDIDDRLKEMNDELKDDCDNLDEDGIKYLKESIQELESFKEKIK